MKCLLRKHEAASIAAMKYKLRLHEAKRTHAAQQHFICKASSCASAHFMHHRCASFPEKQKRTSVWMSFSFFWRRHPDLNRGIADLQSTALPLGYGAIWSGRRGSNSLPPPWQGGALPDELRPHLWCPRSESNQRHADFQSAALPTELQGQTYAAADLVGTTGLEPVTLCL